METGGESYILDKGEARKIVGAQRTILTSIWVRKETIFLLQIWSTKLEIRIGQIFCLVAEWKGILTLVETTASRFGVIITGNPRRLNCRSSLASLF
jgi:hypothetical protein